ncbi:hypothetical protein KP509_03G026500 [Ceratopteris richardii]|uniref:AB hydrolase-1 domain-containing protein n=1 Tax=Ceratopteris richardii TaxID=49495 RepID=A0A8T2V1V6_CERRI|nr:hypothetical protein KP509_03G026500 [Ceratopteris richardii]
MEGHSTPKFVCLPHNGRKLSYLEMGCSQEEAKHSLVVLHGVGSSRLAAMPGVSEETLKAFGVRLIALDRPGYGQSDPDPDMTLESACDDLEQVLDILRLGIALWCPIGCYHWKGISHEDRLLMQSKVSHSSRLLASFGNRLPFFLLRWYISLAIARRAGKPWVQNCQKCLCSPDRLHLQLLEPSDLMLRDNLEALTTHKGYGMARDLHLVSNHWGFELEDIAEVYTGPIHIWQGDEDNLVPIHMQRFVEKKIPENVQLREMKGEGHLSWFCFNNEAHRETLTALFGEVETSL